MRGATYLLAAVNYNVGQGAIVYFVHRARGVPVVRGLATVLLHHGHQRPGAPLPGDGRRRRSARRATRVAPRPRRGLGGARPLRARRLAQAWVRRAARGPQRAAGRGPRRPRAGAARARPAHRRARRLPDGRHARLRRRRAARAGLCPVADGLLHRRAADLRAGARRHAVGDDLLLRALCAGRQQRARRDGEPRLPSDRDHRASAARPRLPAHASAGAPPSTKAARASVERRRPVSRGRAGG